jgi:hypothetical protein
MQISPRALLGIIPHKDLQKKRLKVGAAVAFVRRHFCSQMTISGNCTTQCSNCALHIQSAMDKVEGASNPNAMLVTKLRFEVASIVEKIDEDKQPTVKLDEFGQPVNTDLFADMFAELS